MVHQLSMHFTLQEATFSSTAIRLGISNVPDEAVKDHMEVTAEWMEDVRSALGNRKVHIDSWFRSPELNTAVRGSKNSAHIEGWAVDFVCPEFGSPPQIALYLSNRPKLHFDQIIHEGGWVHISFAPTLRREVLTAHFVPGQPVSYTPGVVIA